ncbi:MAG: asparagine synthase (glutamine-hydrolyzing), partial [Candidatus Kapaibacteriota bacterium]
MCGIVGVLSLDNKEVCTPDTLERMANIIFHRGPDSNGVFISKNKKCGLAFRRLSIIDLSPAGNQPMSTSDGNITIVFNGEIYNYLKLRNELMEKGYVFRSRTDTEVILYGYKEWGYDVVKRLSGMFAFVLWDEVNKVLFGARDRIGKKPLYYYFQNNVFIFASEIKSILLHPKVSKQTNLGEIANYLNFGATINRNTLFKNIFKIPPAHFFIFSLDGELKIHRYWNPFTLGVNTTITEEEAKVEIIRLLRQAVKDRMMSDVPFGVFLSGGIDSSLNVALMAEL